MERIYLKLKNYVYIGTGLVALRDLVTQYFVTIVDSDLCGRVGAAHPAI